MLPAAMPRPTRRRLLVLPALLAAVVAAGCGGDRIELAKDDPLYEGAVIFNQRCAGCHTFPHAASEGSAYQVNSSEYKDGPNFDERAEEYQDVLYAIRNGGFSSGPMPQNIAVGREARLVACYVATYSGGNSDRAPSQQAPEGAGRDDCVDDID